MCNIYFLQFRYAFYSLNTISITKIFCQAISFCSSIRRLSLFFRNKLRSIMKIKHKVFVHMKYSKITKSFLAHCGTKIVLYHFHCRKRSLYRCGGGLHSYQNKSFRYNSRLVTSYVEGKSFGLIDSDSIPHVVCQRRTSM